MNNFTFDYSGANDTGTGSLTLAPDVPNATTDDFYPFNCDPMLDWLPEACKWKKYWPIYHLKVSYNSA